MTRTQRIAGWFVLIAFLMVCMALVANGEARAAECPAGIPKCKVLVLTPDMENALMGPNMILDTAEWGNRAGLGGAVGFFRKAIQEAPAGEMPKPAADGKPEPRK